MILLDDLFLFGGPFVGCPFLYDAFFFPFGLFGLLRQSGLHAERGDEHADDGHGYQIA